MRRSLLSTQTLQPTTRTTSEYRLTTRSLSTSSIIHQARPKLKPIERAVRPRRPSLPPNNPYLPRTSLIGVRTKEPSPTASDEQSWRFPILIPNSAVDPRLIRKLRDLRNNNNSSPHQDRQTLDPEIALQVRQDGQKVLHSIVEDWIRNELNVMGTIREETIQVYMKLLLHPSTLALIAEKLKLRTAGRKLLVKASHHPPKRVVPASTQADEELSQLFSYFIGSIYRSLPGSNSTSIIGDLITQEPNRVVPLRLKKYVITLVKHGLTPHTSARDLLIRASQLSGQDSIGNKKGHARAEIRVSQLEIWGERRSKKIRKLVPDQKIHRTKLRMRKAAILKQRWKEEELKMIQWRNRLLQVSAVQQNESIAEQMRKSEHADQIKQWRSEKDQEAKNKLSTSSTTSNRFSKLFDFWPFSSSPSTPTQSSKL